MPKTRGTKSCKRGAEAADGYPAEVGILRSDSEKVSKTTASSEQSVPLLIYDCDDLPPSIAFKYELAMYSARRCSCVTDTVILKSITPPD